VALLRGFDVHPLNITFQAADLASFIESTTEERLQQWDVLIPQGDTTAIELGGVLVKPNKRQVRVDENSVLVSGHRARVASRGIESEGLSPEVISEINQQYRKQNKGKSIPNKSYRERRERPLLLVQAIQAEVSGDKYASNDLIALGLSFPPFDDSDTAKRVLYRVNLVEWKTIAESETDDDIEEPDDDPR
jgi:hypothetical protein